MIYNHNNLTFNILSANIYIQAPGIYKIKPRAFSALVYRVSGTGKLSTAEKTFDLTAGDIFYMPANVGYNAEYFSSNKLLCIHFTDCNYPTAEKITSKNQALFRREFESILSDYKRHLSVNLIKSAVYRLLYSLEAENISEHLEWSAFINQNLSNADFSVTDICKNFNMSESTLYRNFLKQHGISPKQYILKLRLDKALSLLASGNFSVKEVSALSGFSDEKYFSRIIKERFGQPPSAYLIK